MADQIEETMQIEKKEEKKTGTTGNEEQKRKGKRRGRREEKERRGLNILKNYRVTMKIRNCKAKKHCEENVICCKNRMKL